MKLHESAQLSLSNPCTQCSGWFAFVFSLSWLLLGYSYSLAYNMNFFMKWLAGTKNLKDVRIKFLTALNAEGSSRPDLREGR